MVVAFDCIVMGAVVELCGDNLTLFDDIPTFDSNQSKLAHFFS